MKYLGFLGWTLSGPFELDESFDRSRRSQSPSPGDLSFCLPPPMVPSPVHQPCLGLNHFAENFPLGNCTVTLGIVLLTFASPGFGPSGLAR